MTTKMVLTKRLPDKTSKPVRLKKMSHKSVLTKRLPDKTSKPVRLKKKSHKSVLTKRLPDKTSKLVLTKRLPDKTSEAVLTKCLPDKTSADLLKNVGCGINRTICGERRKYLVHLAQVFDTKNVTLWRFFSKLTPWFDLCFNLSFRTMCYDSTPNPIE